MKNIKTFCLKYGISEDQFYGKTTISGYLDLRGLTSIPEGFNPTVGGGLYLRGLTSIPAGFNPTVGGYLDLVGLTSIHAGFNPTVGGNLDLRGLTSIPAGFNPTVGGYLYLGGRDVYVGATGIKQVPQPMLKWIVNDVEYVCVDGIMTEVISRRGNIYRVRRIAHKEVEYLVADGNGNYAHGATIKEAKEDLIYKVTDRRESDYDGLKLSDTLTHEEAVKCYRVITGAYSSGTRNFVENILNSGRKAKYTIAEIIDLTKGQYGSDKFSKFFNNL